MNKIQLKMNLQIWINMEGHYLPFGDGCGIVGYIYVCPKCNHESMFTDCEQGCEKCYHTEEYVCADDWYTEEMKKPEKERAWYVK